MNSTPIEVGRNYTLSVFLFMSIGTQAFLALMRIHFSFFSFTAAGHSVLVYLLISSLTRERINLLGLKVGTYRSGR